MSCFLIHYIFYFFFITQSVVRGKLLVPCLSFVVAAKSVYGSDWNIVANPTPEDEEFMDAVAIFIGSIVKVMAQFPWYRIYPDKFSREFRRALEVCKKYTKFFFLIWVSHIVSFIVAVKKCVYTRELILC